MRPLHEGTGEKGGVRELSPVNLEAKQGVSRWGAQLQLQHSGSRSTQGLARLLP